MSDGNYTCLHDTSTPISNETIDVPLTVPLLSVTFRKSLWF